MRRSAVVSLLALATSLGSAGCEWVLLGVALDDDDCDGLACCESECCEQDCFVEPPPPEPVLPPTVALEVADWPPLGPNGVLTITASSNQELAHAELYFKNDSVAYFSDATLSGSATASGLSLGEGFGQLDVVVYAVDGSWTRAGIEDLLVDLSPPEAYIDRTVLPASGDDLQLWIADAWVVSGCELTVGAITLGEQLEPGYPSTLGVEWDFSLVSFPVEELPVGNHAAQLRVWDAAGNEVLLDIPIAIDGLPPEVDILEPAEGETVQETFTVSASASDDMPFPVAIELRVGGALIATGTAPQATFTLSALDFPAGEHEITAIAIDEAGNESAIATRTIVIASEPEATP